MTRRGSLVAAAAALLLLVLVGSAGARTFSSGHATGLKLTALARRWVQRDLITIGVSVHPSGVVCRLSVRYADGQYQPNLGPIGVTNGQAK